MLCSTKRKNATHAKSVHYSCKTTMSWLPFVIHFLHCFLSPNDYAAFSVCCDFFYSTACSKLNFVFKDVIPISFLQRSYKHVKLIRCKLPFFAPTLISLEYADAPVLSRADIPTSLHTLILHTFSSCNIFQCLPLGLRILKFTEIVTDNNFSRTNILPLHADVSWPSTLTSLSINTTNLPESKDLCLPTSLSYLSLECAEFGPYSYNQLPDLQTLELRFNNQRTDLLSTSTHMGKLLDLPSRLKRLLLHYDIDKRPISEIKSLPESLQEFDSDGLVNFALPPNLKLLACTDYVLQDPPLPPTLTHLHLHSSNSQIQTVCHLTNLKHLTWHFKDTVLRSLPVTVSKLVASMGNIHYLSGSNVTHIDVVGFTESHYHLGRDIRSLYPRLNTLSFQMECSLTKIMCLLGFLMVPDDEDFETKTVLLRKLRVDNIQSKLIVHYFCLSCKQDVTCDFRLINLAQIHKNTCPQCDTAQCTSCAQKAKHIQMCSTCCQHWFRMSLSS